MAEFPALPLWTDAYLGDTTHLTTIEHGAYLLLLMTAWRTRDCALPDDDRLLARYARLSAQQWKRMRPILEPFFRVEDGAWTQRRLSDERDAVKRFRESQSEKGKKGGKAKSLKYNGRHVAGAENGHDAAMTGAQPECDLPYSYSNIPLDIKSNGANASDLPDPDKVMFDSGITLLGRSGMTEARARPLLGKWRRDYGTGTVIEALSRAQREGAIEPVSFIEGCLRAASRGPPEPERPIC